MGKKRLMQACVSSRDLLLGAAVALAVVGPVAVAAIRPGWHVGQWLGGIELLIFALLAAPAGLVLSAVAAAPPSRLRPTITVVSRLALLAAALAPVLMVGFRLVRGVPLTPYTNGMSCSASSPTHVMLLAMAIFPLTGFLLGASAAHGIGSVWQRLGAHRSVLARLVVTVAITGVIGLLAIPMLVTSPFTFVTACAVLALVPALTGNRLLTAAGLASLATAVLLGVYL
jgi:hypothetical protein